MKIYTATKRATSQRFFSVLLLLTLASYGVAIGQRTGAARATIRISVGVISRTGTMGNKAGLVSSMLREMETMQDVSAGEITGLGADGRNLVESLPALNDGETSISGSRVSGFGIEDIYFDPLQGVSEILGSHGELYIRRSLADDQNPSVDRAARKAPNELVIVSVAD